jgi:hypothetical protein
MCILLGFIYQNAHLVFTKQNRQTYDARQLLETQCVGVLGRFTQCVSERKNGNLNISNSQ